MTDQSVVDFIDNLLKEEEEDGYPVVSVGDVPSSTLQNHQIGRAGQRTFYVTADIHSQDMKKTNGANPTEYADKWARESGYACDKPGLIIPKEFGGSGELNNVFPQSKFMDTTILDNDKKEVQKHLMENQSSRYAKIMFAFEYIEDGAKFHRPIRIYYRFLLYENGTVVQEFCNKLLNIYRD